MPGLAIRVKAVRDTYCDKWISGYAPPSTKSAKFLGIKPFVRCKYGGIRGCSGLERLETVVLLSA